MWLSDKPSRLRLKEAQNARKNRQEIIKARSLGQITRRDLLKWGLITAGGALAWKHGLNPFVRSAYAGIPTGLPPSPLFGQLPFTQPMPRFDVLVRNANPFTFLAPAPTKEANTTQQPLDPRLPGVAPGDTGPIEGRPPGAIWAHQGWEQFLPQIAIEVTQEGAKNNTTYRPEVPSSLNSDIDPTQAIPVRFHPGFPTQQQNSVWTFNGTVPPKLAQVRYREPVRCFPHQTSGGHRIPPPSSALHTDASTLAGKTVPPLRQPCSGNEGATVVPPNRKAVPQRTGESIPESTLRPPLPGTGTSI